MAQDHDDPTRQGSLRLRFPKASRLLRRCEFLRVQQDGQRLSIGPLIVCFLPNTLGRLRVGLTVSRKVGKAHFRNRVRRLMREAVRRILLQMPWQLDIVLIAKRDLAEDLKQIDMDRAIEQLVRRLRNATRTPPPTTPPHIER